MMKIIADFLRSIFPLSPMGTPMTDGMSAGDVIKTVAAEEEEPVEAPPATEAANYSPVYQIKEDKLKGVKFYTTKNSGGVIDPKYLIIHYTANGSVAGTVKHFQNVHSDVSAHLIIGRDGEIVQMAPFKVETWHAGYSQWGPDKMLNNCSIGIELVNWGLLDRGDDGNYYTWTSTKVPKTQVQSVKENGRVYHWHEYTGKQIEVCFDVARDLVKHYGIETVLGHYEVSPGRKVDPGPLFPLAKLREYVQT